MKTETAPVELGNDMRWRASRYGIDGSLIDFGQKRESQTRSLIHEILEFIAPEVDELGSLREIARIEKILGEGTGADRQLRVWEASGRRCRAVVDHIIAEPYEGLRVPYTPDAAT